MGNRRDLPTRERARRTPGPSCRTCFPAALFILLAICVVGVRPADAAINVAVSDDGRVDVVRCEQTRERITVALGGPARRLVVLRSIDTLRAVTVSDIDADGDLDVVGMSERYGILLWRNTGEGGFVAARPAQTHVIVRHAAPERVSAAGGVSYLETAVTDPDRHAMLQAEPALFGASPVALVVPQAEPASRAAAVVRSSRAPPPDLI